MVNKIHELKIHVIDLKPDIILVCESWTHGDITNDFLHIDGYSLEVRKDRTDTTCGRGGGLLVYTRIGIKLSETSREELDAFNQCCGMNLSLGDHSDLSLVFAYRPPSEDAENTEKLCNIVRKLSGTSLLIGDINLSGIDWNRMHSDGEGR